MSLEFSSAEEAKDYAEYTLGVDDDAVRRYALDLSSFLEISQLYNPNSEKVITQLRNISGRGEQPRIADIGTGPGNWLFDVRAQLREEGINAILDGYDLYPAMFPPEETSKAEDVNFSELNIHTKEQFIPLEKYDVIHIRYLSAAIGPEQWDGAFDNCMSILKPGGIFMWEELLLEKMSINDPTKWTNVLAVFKLNWSILRRNDVDPKLSSLFSTKLEEMTKEEFTTQSLPEKGQRMQAANMSMATKELVDRAVEHGEAVVKHLGLESAEQLQGMLKLAQKDFKEGCVLHMPVNRWAGVKPLGIATGRTTGDGSGDLESVQAGWAEAFKKWLC